MTTSTKFPLSIKSFILLTFIIFLSLSVLVLPAQIHSENDDEYEDIVDNTKEEEIEKKSDYANDEAKNKGK